ncbi:MAG: hypothetical protein ACRD2I_01300 [Vicinamibacterales bacterium]
MSMPGLRHPLDTWAFVVGLLRAVTQPAADVAACDARVEMLADGSRIVRALMAATDAFSRAASESAVLALWRRTVPALAPDVLEERVRAIGSIAAVAAVTNLILRVAGTGTEPLTWTVPVAVALVALTCIVGSRSIARAIASYHS